jgi:hypothetical protein
MSDPHHASEVPTPQPGTLPQTDGSSLTGGQLVALMGGALLLALIFLDLVSG